jgi:phosphoglycerol transferase MdoB-like AlkP superfamily enzyme
MKLNYRPHSPLVAAALNILLAYAVYMLCRVAYVWENWTIFAQGWDNLNLWNIVRGGLRYDGAAIAYTNCLYVILMLLPVIAKEKSWWQTLCKWYFVVVNSLAVAVNLCDAVYSQYTGRRTTSTFFSEFGNENNLGKIFTTELLNHWYLVLAGAAMIALLWLLYTKPQGDLENAGSQDVRRRSRWTQSLALTLALPLTVVAMRGGIINTYRPLSLADANQYVNQPNEAAIVLNTPFSVIRTIGKSSFEVPHYFDDARMQALYTPVHLPDSSAVPTHRNVVVLIVESFGREYIGFYNRTLDDGTYKGYTPFVDSLLGVSLTWQETFANGRTSIDGMPAVLASIPMFIEPFFFTGYSLNKVSGIPGELSKIGYSSAFFHGADNGSMGFQAAARSMGFEAYYGRNEYDADSRFGGEADFDGTWAIWDEPFLQYFATKMGEMREPFVTAVFTASSHHPFVIPEQYKETFPEEELVMHKCIRYADHALRRFFETASRQPWYNNTIFVLTSDHTNMSNHDYYRSPIGLFRGPILIFDPSGQLPRGIRKGVAQQIDIMPTLLGILGYDKPYLAFGRDLMDTAESGWTVNYSGGIYQYLEGDTLIQFDGNNVTGTYNIVRDPLMKKPLKTPPSHHLQKLQAIIQQYMQRMVGDKLTVGQPPKE